MELLPCLLDPTVAFGSGPLNFFCGNPLLPRLVSLKLSRAPPLRWSPSCIVRNFTTSCPPLSSVTFHASSVILSHQFAKNAFAKVGNPKTTINTHQHKPVYLLYTHCSYVCMGVPRGRYFTAPGTRSVCFCVARRKHVSVSMLCWYVTSAFLARCTYIRPAMKCSTWLCCCCCPKIAAWVCLCSASALGGLVVVGTAVCGQYITFLREVMYPCFRLFP